ncbi:MAG: hypothetical protein E6G17_12070 [Actinobacteria bacterium]|nr:MAG: hypothetical protein E6G17_12070 [Actinomycetota bacterium]
MRRYGVRRHDLDAPSLISGLLFLLLGLAFLAKQTGWVDVEAAWVWPALLVGLGLAGLAGAGRGEER